MIKRVQCDLFIQLKFICRLVRVVNVFFVGVLFVVFIGQVCNVMLVCLVLLVIKGVMFCILLGISVFFLLVLIIILILVLFEVIVWGKWLFGVVIRCIVKLICEFRLLYFIGMLNFFVCIFFGFWFVWLKLLLYNVLKFIRIVCLVLILQFCGMVIVLL